MTKRAARRAGRLHLIGVVVWLVLAVPTVIWWKDSVLWVAFCSLYANAGFHLGAWQATRAEHEASSD
jgi:hypothetical protein